MTGQGFFHQMTRPRQSLGLSCHGDTIEATLWGEFCERFKKNKGKSNDYDLHTYYGRVSVKVLPQSELGACVGAECGVHACC